MSNVTTKTAVRLEVSSGDLTRFVLPEVARLSSGDETGSSASIRSDADSWLTRISLSELPAIVLAVGFV